MTKSCTTLDLDAFESIETDEPSPLGGTDNAANPTPLRGSVQRAS